MYVSADDNRGVVYVVCTSYYSIHLKTFNPNGDGHCALLVLVRDLDVGGPVCNTSSSEGS